MINDYIERLEKKIKIKGVLLFGSFAYGHPTKHSDVDLAIISPDFQKKDFWNRVDWLTFMRKNVADTIAMDVFGYTPSEFRDIEKHSAIMAVAKKRGKWIYQK
ncbi:hypothetical protein A2316_00610 [Candidatus Falkowbacteria bacterium RIFOXYB2_FULL_38_15]|uniref:Polymerase nucleotidyl transferase domain-containing protein n=1 Tax=Candidatus Falkowbacteria bacterium RIFOXYA2_FULL_38_12 TaxID=1797993 RepID=A0A1F5S2H5_9BACT|nr:MAG: hypothetical protein A2257_00105 [Candidatus Falkowbacteria bacterium RIFOXYA2_FULL_38_12]OGF32705.1 MAG: hypothetical protein A2316_00610 [Candidatus Falkowbacteria bacterium RIFOXYB2_FULL_38_15]